MTSLTTIQPAKADIIRMIESNPKLANSTKAQYKKAIKNYLATGNSLADSEAISQYAATLSKSSKAFLKSAIRLWTERVALQAKSQSTPETVNAVTATLHRLDAINDAIQVKQSKGQKAHVWLTQTEVRQLLNHCDDTITGKRDRVVLSVLLGAGLRRSELAALTFDSIKMQGNRTVLEITGKGAKDRVIPISDKLSQLLTEWQQIAGDGYIARSLGMNRELGESLYLTLPKNNSYSRHHRRFVSQLIDQFRATHPNMSIPSAEEMAVAIPAQLSPREREILQLLDEGLDNKALARRLTVADSTVGTHLRNVYRKLEVTSRTQAIKRAREVGLI